MSAKRTIGLKERLETYKEIVLPLPKNEAMEEAKRCLQCSEPKCVQGCPAGVNCKEFIRLLKEEKLEEAKKEILLHNSAPCVTSRVCQVQKQCEGNCILAKSENAINISGLERFISDNARKAKEPLPKTNGKKIAIVGSGPAGLAAAIDFGKLGYAVTIFESEKKIGGKMTDVIPKYRLPENAVKSFVEDAMLGKVEIRLNERVGDNLLLDGLIKQFDAVLVASGEEKAKQLSIKGNELNGVWYWNDFLKEFNGKTGKLEKKKTIVIGGGDTAIDCARVAIRNNADVTIAYRKPKDFMPAQKKEIAEAEEEGVKFQFLLSPMEFAGTGRLETAVFEKVTAEREHLVMSGQMEKIPADLVVVAAGQQAENDLLNKTDFEGELVDAHSNKTKMDKVFAAGDIVNRNKTIIHAIRSAKETVKEIDDYLSGRSVIPEGITKI